MKTFFLALMLSAIIPSIGMRANDNTDTNGEWELVWSDEFDYDGAPDSTAWNFEHGYIRNHEAQWYQKDNAVCRDGVLVIEGKKTDDPQKPYTSSSLTTLKKKEFKYGRFEVRAKIPVGGGAWPAIWLHGTGLQWPSCGEIDMMECYPVNGEPHLLANACWGTDKQLVPKWDMVRLPLSHFTEKDPDWKEKFHVWRMDWDEKEIKLYVDDELLNEVKLSETVNGSFGRHINPFTRPLYIIVNLAMGGDAGGEIDDSMLPFVYEIDYVRVYQKK